MKFTIIIPTRERADVLAGALRTAVMQEYDELEIIVSDNFSQDGTRDVVASFGDPRIRYLNTGKRLSMSHNWEFALSHVSGGWLTILGDDDGLLPGSIGTVAEIARTREVEAVQSRGSTYLWPSLTQTAYGRLSVILRHDLELRETSKWFRKVIDGKASYTALPTLYTGGFVSHDLVRRAQGKAAAFYHSMIPDVFSAVVLAQFTDRYVYSHRPLAVGGASKHSTGAASFSDNSSMDSGNAPAQPFFQEPNIPFHAALPLLGDGSCPKSAQALVYEALLQSRSLIPDMPEITSPQQQLEIILRDAKRRHRAELTAWARQFASLHNIDFDKAARAAQAGRLRRKAARRAAGLRDRYHTVTLDGNSNLPIRDIHEASITAAAIMELLPGMKRHTMKRLARSRRK